MSTVSTASNPRPSNDSSHRPRRRPIKRALCVVVGSAARFFSRFSLSLLWIGRKVNHNRELSRGEIVRDFPVDNDELQIDIVLVRISMVFPLKTVSEAAGSMGIASRGIRTERRKLLEGELPAAGRSRTHPRAKMRVSASQ